MNLSGTWRFAPGMPVFVVEHDSAEADKFTFHRTDGDRESYFGHGVIEGDKIVISWRSTMWIGHGSDESRKVKLDRITQKPIEIHWLDSENTWLTVSN